MVERIIRDRAASLVEQLRDGQISNFDFEARWPHAKKDRALDAIRSVLWGFYDDLREHKLIEEFGLSREARILFDRCVLFLYSNLEYVGAEDSTTAASSVPAGGILGLSNTGSSFSGSGLVSDDSAGDAAAWPFFTLSDYEQARRQIENQNARREKDGHENT